MTIKIGLVESGKRRSGTVLKIFWICFNARSCSSDHVFKFGTTLAVNSHQPAVVFKTERRIWNINLPIRKVTELVFCLRRRDP